MCSVYTSISLRYHGLTWWLSRSETENDLPQNSHGMMGPGRGRGRGGNDINFQIAFHTH